MILAFGGVTDGFLDKDTHIRASSGCFLTVLAGWSKGTDLESNQIVD